MDACPLGVGQSHIHPHCVAFWFHSLATIIAHSLDLSFHHSWRLGTWCHLLSLTQQSHIDFDGRKATHSEHTHWSPHTWCWRQKKVLAYVAEAEDVCTDMKPAEEGHNAPKIAEGSRCRDWSTVWHFSWSAATIKKKSCHRDWHTVLPLSKISTGWGRKAAIENCGLFEVLRLGACFKDLEDFWGVFLFYLRCQDLHCTVCMRQPLLTMLTAACFIAGTNFCSCLCCQSWICLLLASPLAG